MSPKTAMLVLGGDVDAERVLAINDAIFDAVSKVYGGDDQPKNGYDLIEGVLANACTIIRSAPDEATQAALAERALGFITRNAGIAPAAILSARLARRHDAAVRHRAHPLASTKTEGSA